MAANSFQIQINRRQLELFIKALSVTKSTIPNELVAMPGDHPEINPEHNMLYCTDILIEMLEELRDDKEHDPSCLYGLCL